MSLADTTRLSHHDAAPTFWKRWLCSTNHKDIGTLFFIGSVIYALVAGKKAPANPWGEGATTLEWTLPSPPPFTATRRSRSSIEGGSAAHGKRRGE